MLFVIYIQDFEFLFGDEDAENNKQTNNVMNTFKYR